MSVSTPIREIISETSIKYLGKGGGGGGGFQHVGTICLMGTAQNVHANVYPTVFQNKIWANFEKFLLLTVLFMH